MTVRNFSKPPTWNLARCWEDSDERIARCRRLEVFGANKSLRFELGYGVKSRGMTFTSGSREDARGRERRAGLRAIVIQDGLGGLLRVLTFAGPLPATMTCTVSYD